MEWDLSNQEDCFDQSCLPNIQQFDIKQEDIKMHERFRHGTEITNVLNKVALIRLLYPANRNIGVQFACFPNAATELADNISITII